METLLHLLVFSFLPLMVIAIVRGLADIRRALSSADVTSEPASPPVLALALGQLPTA